MALTSPCITYLVNDYTFGQHNVTILAGDTVGLLDIIIINDNIVEETESFSLTINATSLPEGILTGEPSRTTVNILDSDGMLARTNNPMKLPQFEYCTYSCCNKF